MERSLKMTESSKKNKPIRLSKHARGQLEFRGILEEEVIQTIRESDWEPAELGRLQSHKDFSYKAIIENGTEDGMASNRCERFLLRKKGRLWWLRFSAIIFRRNCNEDNL